MMIWLISVLVCAIGYLYWKKVCCEVPQLPSYIGNLDMSNEKDIDVLINTMHKVASEIRPCHLNGHENIAYVWLCTQGLARKPYGFMKPRRKKQFLEFMALAQRQKDGIKLYNQYMLDTDQPGDDQSKDEVLGVGLLGGRRMALSKDDDLSKKIAQLDVTNVGNTNKTTRYNNHLY